MTNKIGKPYYVSLKHDFWLWLTFNVWFNLLHQIPFDFNPLAAGHTYLNKKVIKVIHKGHKGHTYLNLNKPTAFTVLV